MYGLRYRGSLDSTTQAELEGLVATLQEFLLREHNEDGTHRPVESDLAPVPVGGVIAWMTATPPPGWLLCDGRAVSRTTYARLFKVIGTAYGTGNGVDTFNLPNMEGRFPLGSFSGASIGATGGTWNHTHGIDGDGTHDHGGATGSAGAHDHGGFVTSLGTDTPNDVEEVQAGTGALVADNFHTHPVTGGFIDVQAAHSHTVSAGGSHDHGGETGEANPPYFALNFIILAGA